MNDAFKTREKGKTLLIVEGKSEKEELFKTLFKCFKELEIDDDKIWIYNTNIYNLYRQIEKEYDNNWFNESIYDVDLPWLISKNDSNIELSYRDDFKNIYLVFDYERHDPRFDASKITNMQMYFNDAANNGQLYINYPMFESYKDLVELPEDSTFKDKKIHANLRKGSIYKNSVKETIVSKNIDLSKIVKKIFDKYLQDLADPCIEELFSITCKTNIEIVLKKHFIRTLDERELNEMTMEISALFDRMHFLENNISYWDNMKNIFKSIIIHNIRKANMIQNGIYDVKLSDLNSEYKKLDLCKILKSQNEISGDNLQGFIWILNTCLFLIPEYKFSLIEKSVSE